jgi:hypothetical protein
MTGKSHRSRWRLPTLLALISAGLGIAINFATDLKTSLWAWFAVGVLVLASIIVAVSAESMKERRDLDAQKRSIPEGDVGDRYDDSGSRFEAGSITQAGRDVVGRDINYHQEPVLRTVVAVCVVVWVTAVGGLIAGAQLRGPTGSTDHTQEVGAGDLTPTLGTLRMSQSVRAYYPENGTLPSIPPPDYDHNDVQGNEDFCGIYFDWARQVRAASNMPIMTLTTIAGATSPITILDLRVIVYAKHTIVRNNFIRCLYAAGGFPGTTANVDLDHPLAPTILDIGASGDQHTTLPGGRFVVDPKNAESLFIFLKGSPGQVYDYAVQLKIVENSQEQTKAFGSPGDPYRLAFTPDAKSIQYYGWDYSRRAWTTGDPNKPSDVILAPN